MPSVCTVFHQCHSPRGSDDHPASTPTDRYMKGTTQRTKRSRNRRGKRTRRSPQKAKKMLPARVARLLNSNAKGMVKIGQDVFCSTGKTGGIGVFARGDGSVTNVSRLCNIEGNSRTLSSRGGAGCHQKCGIELCAKSDSVTNKNVGVLTSVAKSFISSTAINNDAGENTPSSSSISANDNNSNTYENTPDSVSSSSDRHSRCIALDCEMVGIGEGGSCSALARCSIVDYEGEVVYDKYVKPDAPIVDFRTPWSGIVEEHMEIAIPFHQAQKEVSKILKDKIVIGHAVASDFSVLNLTHPADDVRDTSRYRGLRFMAGEDGKKRSVGLKAMTKRLLGKQIQIGPHCSVEDARATMSLYRLVDGQWEEDANSMYPERQFKSCFLDDHFWPEDL